MSKNHRCFNLFLGLTALLIFTESAWGIQPDWIRAHQKGDLKLQGVYNGVGFAPFEGRKPDYDALRLARDRALDELCYQLSVSIKSKFADRIVKSAAYEDQQITSSLFISTRQTLSGIKAKDKWTDSRGHRHWVLLVIDKQAADRQLEQQKFINEVADRLEHKQAEVQKGLEQITLLLNNNMQAYSDQVVQLGKLMKVIDGKVGDASTQTKKEYALIREDIQRLESRRKAYEERVADTQERQQDQISVLIQQNNDLKTLLAGLSREIQSDYFLSLADDDLRIKSENSDFWVKIEPDKGQGATYLGGQKVSFRVRASRKCFVKVIYLSSTGQGAAASKQMMNTVLFPNQHDPDNQIRAGQVKVIGKMGELEILPPYGKDIVTVIASENPFSDLQQTLKTGPGGYHSEVTANTRDAVEIRSRGISVAKPAGGSISKPGLKKSRPGLVASDTCFIVSRAR